MLFALPIPLLVLPVANLVNRYSAAHFSAEGRVIGSALGLRTDPLFQTGGVYPLIELWWLIQEGKIELIKTSGRKTYRLIHQSAALV